MVEQKYAELGGEGGFLGAPLGPEADTPDGNGRFREFSNGTIYWSPESGAFEVNGAIRDKWLKLGGLDFLGYPLSDELPPPDGRGRFNQFQQGFIYWTPEYGAVAIYGLIYRKWEQMGLEAGVLGYPTTDEKDTSDGRGRMNLFEHGAIYWTSEKGAFEVHGLIFGKWQELGLEESWLGLPVSDEEPSTDPAWQRQSRFENGVIKWSADKGAAAFEN
jgi:uncharacterized protein with LGFP repeats